MAALAGATQASHQKFTLDNYVAGLPRGPAIDAPVWVAAAEIWNHGPSATHTQNVRNTLTETDVESGVAELDQFTNVAILQPSEVNITAAVHGLGSALGLQGQAFPGPEGYSTLDELTAQHGEAFRAFHNETILDLLATLTNHTDLSGATLSVDGFTDITTAAKTDQPIGQTYHAIAHVLDLKSLIKDIGSLGNNRALLVDPLSRQRPQGYAGNWEGVELFSSNQIDQADGTHWTGALLTGQYFDPNIYTSPTPLGGVLRPSGLVGGPIRMTIIEYLAQRSADLASSQRLGEQKITYSYIGAAKLDEKQGRRWTTNK